MNQEYLRAIPKVDELLREPSVQAMAEKYTTRTVTDAVRAVLEDLRRELLEGGRNTPPDKAALCATIQAHARRAALPSLRSVINGTGVVLHTNMGRACMSERAAEAARDVARSYNTLEYDVEGGCRGDRCAHVEGLLTRLTGAESALTVNNNAAAVLLILSAMATGGEVIVSRGELVEIGGSFRIPEIMETCGARLREVGTTNKTHLGDYEKAICEDTRALMKVHTSNFRVVGFTKTVSPSELAQLGHSRGLPVIEDLGSGSLVNLARLGLRDEPTVQESVAAGVDLVSFSGDKLLGGPQAGIIVGREEYLSLLREHPLYRAMRVDKMVLAALEATLRAYVEETAETELPTLAMLAVSPETLRMRAQRLCALAREVGANAEVIPGEDQVGGGSVPTQTLPSFAVAVMPARGGVAALEAAMRLRERPIIGRVAHDRYLLDARTLREDEFSCIVDALRECLR
ncbi:L-seryl-tRNA(Sec) selenium transferase [Oscillibacter sp.]|uniref:L-seryl-tRNA(Sec) selenium transferase n=1 Tax=Oscillibacter sp. TaxID=1945593 RepID=UPI0028A69415|nr:L-seryl-tRNA(Sec) selenium transferase [Oscillibacter sp.]